MELLLRFHADPNAVAVDCFGVDIRGLRAGECVPRETTPLIIEAVRALTGDPDFDGRTHSVEMPEEPKSSAAIVRLLLHARADPYVTKCRESFADSGDSLTAYDILVASTAPEWQSRLVAYRQKKIHETRQLHTFRDFIPEEELVRVREAFSLLQSIQ